MWSGRSRPCAQSSLASRRGLSTWCASVSWRAGGGPGCLASASVRVRAGSGPRMLVALAPRGAWCPGAGVLSAVAVRGGVRGGNRAAARAARTGARAGGNLVGRLLLGPTSRVERADDPCDPVARPAPLTLVALDASGRRGRAHRHARRWQLRLRPARRQLHAACRCERAPRFPRIADTRVVVSSQATRSRPQRVVLAGDTGIR